MKTPVDERLVEEAARFRFRFACPDCAYFDAQKVCCSEGYPLDEHLSPRLETPEILFCKLFEMA